MLFTISMPAPTTKTISLKRTQDALKNHLITPVWMEFSVQCDLFVVVFF